MTPTITGGIGKIRHTAVAALRHALHTLELDDFGQGPDESRRRNTHFVRSYAKYC